MIIAKPEWFERRKYWIRIKTWQGAVYTGIFLILLLTSVLIAIGTENLIFAVLYGLIFAFYLVDTHGVLWKIKRDEREKMLDAIAERNAAYGMMLILSLGLIFELIYNILQNRVYVDPFLVIALIAGKIIKDVTNYKLEKES
jgi:uncharacterized membrane protein